MSERVKNANITGQAASQLQSVPGGPSPAAIAQTNTDAQNAIQSKNYVVIDGYNQGTNEFPYVPFAPDPYDTIAHIKHEALGGTKPVVAFEKEDAEYLLRQRAQVENADYDRWVMQKYDLTDPAQNFLMQQIAPDQFQRRLDLIDYQQALVSKYARIRLLGAKSQEDLRFEWLVETGRIELPMGPIWDPVTWMDNQLGGKTMDGDPDDRSKNNRARFTKGFWNPLEFLSEENTGWAPKATNRSDPRGDPTKSTVGQVFTGSEKPVYGNWGTNLYAAVDGSAASQVKATQGLVYGYGRHGADLAHANDAAQYKTAAEGAKKGYGQ